MFYMCLKIFLARITDVSLGTIRTVLVVRGKRIIPSVIAFFETLVWFLVAREALNTSLNSWLIPIFYSLGYALGTFIGGYISNNFVEGLITVEVITKYKGSTRMIKEIRNAGFGISIIDLKSSKDKIKKVMLLINLNKSKLKELTKIIRSNDSFAFVIVNDTRYAQNGVIK